MAGLPHARQQLPLPSGVTGAAKLMLEVSGDQVNSEGICETNHQGSYQYSLQRGHSVGWHNGTLIHAPSLTRDNVNCMEVLQ